MKKPLFVNADETNIPFHLGGRRGLVLSKSTPSLPGHLLARAFAAKTSRRDLRTSVTHLATICDDAALQPVMPHFIIGSRRCFSNALLSDLGPHVPANVHLIRSTSSWCNSQIFDDFLLQLHGALAVCRDTRQPILILDTAPCHLSKSTWALAAKLRILLCYVPARLTHLLQPLDTHAFACYKAFLRREYRAAQAASPTGSVCSRGWLRLLCRGARFLASKRWQRAFAEVGASSTPCGDMRGALTRDLQEALTTIPPVPDGCPVEADYAHIFPAQRSLPPKGLLTAALHRRRLVGKRPLSSLGAPC